MKTLVTAGCSFTKDNYQQTWADYLANSIGYTLNNVAARGAGIEFVSKRIMYECLIHHTDLAVVMLPSIDRFDWYIDRQHPWHNSGLSIASWKDGKESNLVQLDGTLSQESGYILSGGEVRGHKQQWYKFYYNESSALVNYWTTVYNLENFFKIQNIRYYFTTAYNRNHLVEQATNITGHTTQHEFLFHAIDWSRFIFYNTDQGFLSFTKDYKFDIINNHPVTQAHQTWVDSIILPAINEN